jgi:C4-dicarboxylate transporter DctM subunit
MIVLIMLVLGCVLEAIVIVLLAGPFFMPIAAHLGFDPVHWGICFVTTLTIGYTTPPYGMNLFVVSGVADVPALRVAKSVIPLVLAMVVSLAFIYLIPPLSLYLVRLVQ